MHDNTNHMIGQRKPTLELALAKWIRLAASPLFCVLACLSLLTPSGGVACMSSSATFAFHDMGLMYLLMSLVHLPTWLTLIGHGLEHENEPQDSQR
ncbi:hypothetical protein [Devosia sp.]|uniref:hypothetical protein n=1 Tax=Devosia sp. TaxID=1871048 RepID=UPI001B0BC7F8|nr:hypothetical protein [Devosia sp.]MBO9591076.1 hypothetical protein [Devosia sp.]